MLVKNALIHCTAAGPQPPYPTHADVRPSNAAAPSSRTPSEFVARHIGIEAARRAPHAVGDRRGVAPRADRGDRAARDRARAGRWSCRAPLTEAQALAELQAHRVARTRCCKSFIGQGYHGTHTPGVILRNVLENPAWYTAYTPYQAEISQGRMEALVNFQTMVTDLTGMAIANASMLDEATAAAEAMTLALRVGKSKSTTFFVADDVLPQTLEVVRTRARPLGITVVVGAGRRRRRRPTRFAALLQYPGVNGACATWRRSIDAVHAQRRRWPSSPPTCSR